MKKINMMLVYLILGLTGFFTIQQNIAWVIYLSIGWIGMLICLATQDIIQTIKEETKK